MKNYFFLFRFRALVFIYLSFRIVHPQFEDIDWVSDMNSQEVGL